MSELALGIGSAHELEITLRKADWEIGDVAKMTQDAELCRQFRAVLRGHAKIETIIRLVDCDAVPFIPNEWEIRQEDQIESRVRGKFAIDSAKITQKLVCRQKKGVVGHELKKLLEGMAVLPTNVLDSLLAHPEFIPDAWKGWKGKYLFFWGTIYRDSYGFLCVRCLCWDGGRWSWACRWLDSYFNASNPAAVSAS